MNFKPIIFAVALLGAASDFYAQSSKGGLPLSVTARLDDVVSRHTYVLPEPDEILVTSAASKSVDGPLQLDYAGVSVDLDIGFPESGSFLASSDDHLIWQMKVTISGAPAIGLYYNRLYLPPGVRLFLKNASASQILGAYTEANNSEADLLFATEAVQGDEVIIELNIAPEADLSQIQLHLNKGVAYFKGIRYLDRYRMEAEGFVPVQEQDDPYGWLEGRSSPCMLNAACGPGEAYTEQQQSVVQLIIPRDNGTIGICGGTLVNNTDSRFNCINYLLTASHCDQTGAETSTAFSQYLIRFNFTYTDCEGDSLSEVYTLTGADFVARSPWPQNPIQNGMPDFLLLRLREGIPASWDAYLAGWDRSPDMPLSLDASKQYTIFHYPSGDVRKLAYSRELTNEFLHAWTFFVPGDGSQGGTAGGSSGSGLFNAEKYLIGVNSLGGLPVASCRTEAGNWDDFYSYISSYKLSSAWEWRSTATRQLKDWLDPTNSGVMQINGRKACTGNPSSLMDVSEDQGLENIALYPNPSANGRLKVQFQFDRPEVIYAEVYSVSGKRVGAYQLTAATSGSSSLDLSGLAKGMYLIKFYYAGQSVSKKVMIR